MHAPLDKQPVYTQGTTYVWLYSMGRSGIEFIYYSICLSSTYSSTDGELET
jgi:hypothetical protein